LVAFGRGQTGVLAHQQGPGGIDHVHGRVAEHRVRPRAQGGQIGGQEIGRNPVVLGNPLEIRAVRDIEHGLKVRGDPDVLGLPLVDDAAVAGGEIAADLGRAVARCVIRDEETKILEGLSKHGLDAGLEIAFAVVDWQTDPDGWGLTIRHAATSFPHS
jgi:hypothetical protein